jgi:superfamily II DNA or RNA helicase
MDNFLSKIRLLEGKPTGLVRAIERTLLHAGFDDVRVVDGANDHGADLVASKGRKIWVIQSKWTSSETIDAVGVNDCERALRHYKADRALLVTNARLSPKAEKRIQELEQIGVQVTVWDGKYLSHVWDNRLEDRSKNSTTLRPYQAEASTQLLTSLSDNSRALLVLATGLGKTVVASSVAAEYLKPGGKILVLAHLKELVEQLERAFWASMPKSTNTQVLHGDSSPASFDGCTFATPESALKLLDLDYEPDLIILDECHHLGPDSTYARLLDNWSEVPRLGLTATPWRGDHFNVETYFGPASFKMGITEGMSQGFLSDVDYKIFTDSIDWDLVREKSEFGYSIKELNKNLFLPQRDDKIIDELRLAWNKTARPQAIVFCSTIEHAEIFTKLLQTREPLWAKAQTIHSGMPKRDRNVILNNFRAGRIPVISCVDVFNEGVDVPDVSIIAFLRVTHSRRIFVQQLGRGLRLSKGKAKLLVLDFVSDIRRLAAVYELKKSFENEIESLNKLSETSISFEDKTAANLIEYWLQDAADLETAHDESRLNFPDPDVFHS